MDASAFHTVVTNHTALKPEEVSRVVQWSHQYPYCQVLHLVASRNAHDQKDANQQVYLHRAAVYSTDRSVLKHVMTIPAKSRVDSTPKPEVKPPETKAPAPKPVVQKEETPAKKTESKPPKALQENPLEGDALREDLTFQLHRLHELMHKFEDSYEELQGKLPRKGKSPSPAKAGKVDPAASNETPLIEEIKTSSRKPKLVSPKVAEQGEIIDNFIKVAPTLPRTKPKDAGPDLAEDSVNYGDNIVSETLVEILLKQGKKDKAIEMLRKLIWKFPQKKAYFAAQIEALKS